MLAALSPHETVLPDGIAEPAFLNPNTSQANDLKMDTCHFLARDSVLFWQGKDVVKSVSS